MKGELFGLRKIQMRICAQIEIKKIAIEIPCRKFSFIVCKKNSLWEKMRRLSAMASEFFICRSTSLCRAGISRAHLKPWIFFCPFGTIFPVWSCKVHSPRFETKSRASSTSSGPRSRTVFSDADGISRRTQKFSEAFATIWLESCATNFSVCSLITGGGN